MSETSELIADDSVSQAQLDQVLAAYNENVDQKAEVQVHRVAILQPGSPEIAGGVAGYTVGHFCDNRTREVLSAPAKQPWLAAKGVPEGELSLVPCMLIVPCMKLPTEFMKWIRQEDRKPTDAFPYEFKTLDGSDPRVRAGVWANRGGTFGKNEEDRGKAPPVTDNINFLIVPLHPTTHEMRSSFIINTFSRTSVNAGKALTTYIQGHSMVKLPPWGRTYYLYSKKEFNQEKNSTYYSIQVAPGPLLKDVAPDLEPMVRSMAIWLADKTFGRSRQEAMLNMADISDEISGHGDSTSTTDANTLDGTATVNPLGGAEDPFAGGEQGENEKAASF